MFGSEHYRGDTITEGKPILELFNSIPADYSEEYLFHWPGLIICHTEYKQIYKPSYDRPYFCAFLTYDCKDNRDEMFRLLRSLTSDTTCHAIGKCQNNMEVIKKNSPHIYDHIVSFLTVRDDYCLNERIFRNYRFSLVMENKARLGYITEKIMEAFQAGSIPIYWGGNYSHSIFNPKVLFLIIYFLFLLFFYYIIFIFFYLFFLIKLGLHKS